MFDNSKLCGQRWPATSTNINLLCNVRNNFQNFWQKVVFINQTLGFFCWRSPKFISQINMFVYGVYHPTWEFFTHMETSPLPVKGCKFWPMLGSHGHWAVRVLKRATPTVNTGLPFIMVISEDTWHSHLLPSVWQLSFQYLFLRLRSVATGDRTPISRMRCERSTSTPPRRFSQ